MILNFKEAIQTNNVQILNLRVIHSVDCDCDQLIHTNKCM